MLKIQSLPSPISDSATSPSHLRESTASLCGECWAFHSTVQTWSSISLLLYLSMVLPLPCWTSGWWQILRPRQLPPAVIFPTVSPPGSNTWFQTCCHPYSPGENQWVINQNKKRCKCGWAILARKGSKRRMRFKKGYRQKFSECIIYMHKIV